MPGCNKGWELFLNRPAGDVLLCLHVMHLFHIRLHPPSNERGVPGVHLQVNTTVIQPKKNPQKTKNAFKSNYQHDRIIRK